MWNTVYLLTFHERYKQQYHKEDVASPKLQAILPVMRAVVQLQHSQPRDPPSHTPFLSSTRKSGFPFFQQKALPPSRCAWDGGNQKGHEQHITNTQAKCAEATLTEYRLTGLSFLKPPAAFTHTQTCPFPTLRQHKLNTQLCSFQIQGLFQMWTS